MQARAEHGSTARCARGIPTSSVDGMDAMVVAGVVSTALFAAANVPMLVRALRTRDVGSYSPSSLVIGNAANAVHTVYVISLPPGPIWALHGFYLVSMAAMLTLWLRYARAGTRTSARSPGRGSGGDVAQG
jgi:hypothetical protein